jgi:hypothetical protein
MLEDRLATTYSHATYQENRIPTYNPQTYQYHPPPQSPASPSQSRHDYFPSRRSTVTDNVAPYPTAQAPQESPAMYSNPQNPNASQPPQWSYPGYPPPSTTPAVTKSANPQYQSHVPYHYGRSSAADHQLSSQYQQPQSQAPFESQNSYSLNGDNRGSYQQQSTIQHKEESSLIDL